MLPDTHRVTLETKSLLPFFQNRQYEDSLLGRYQYNISVRTEFGTEKDIEYGKGRGLTPFRHA